MLAFIPEIENIEIINNQKGANIKFANTNSQHASIKEIKEIKNGQEYKRLILHKSNEKVSIAVEIEKTDEGYKILSTENIPKLFCDFPLIGTENFHFPVIVNSFYFNPLTEREGIWLTSNDDKEITDNKKLLQQSIELCKELISYVEENSFSELFNLADTRLPPVQDKYIDFSWYQLSIQNPLKEIVLNAKLVELATDETKYQCINDLWFPKKSYSQTEIEKTWQFNYDLFPEAVCKKEHLSQWLRISWSDWKTLDYDELLKDIQGFKSIEELCKALRVDQAKCFEWLNSVGDFLLEDESNDHYLNKYSIIPNQFETFRCKMHQGKAQLYIDEINDHDLLKVLELLGDTWKEILLHRNVGFGKYPVKKKKNIAQRITDILNNSPVKNDSYIQAIGILSQWFDDNEILGKELFSDLYKKKADLFMNTIKDKEGLYQIMKSGADLTELAKVEVASVIDSNPEVITDLQILLEEFELQSIDELRIALKNPRDNTEKMELTKEELVGLGITNETDLEKLLEEEEFKNLYTHLSTPTNEMYDYAQSLLERAKKKIISYLSKLSGYDCSNSYEIAPSIIGGITKNGSEITVVARPSDNNKVLLYYRSEFDVLEYVDAEFWCEDGHNPPKKITLGQILRETGINRLPIKSVDFSTPDFESLINSPKTEELDFNAIPFIPEKIAKIISSFANCNGGTLIFGIKEIDSFTNDIIGLSTDFKAFEITKKAISLLSPIPKVKFDWVNNEEKSIFVIETEKSERDILLDGEKYIRNNTSTESLQKIKPGLERELNLQQFDRTVGIENYSQISSVKHANADVYRFKKMLIENMNVDEGDIHVFQNEKACQNDIEYDLKALFNYLTERDRLVFYYV
ncbi:MAG: ATP-binding protein, partial [Cyclobacteriaceae bacterium]